MDTASDLDPTGAVAAVNASLKLVRTAVSLAPAAGAAYNSLSGGPRAPQPGNHAMAGLPNNRPVNGGGRGRGASPGAGRGMSNMPPGQPPPNNAASTGPVSPINPEAERRAFEKVNMILKTVGERIVRSGLVNENALARALTQVTAHVEAQLFSIENNKLFQSLGNKLADPRLVNNVFTSIYLFAFLSSELEKSLPRYNGPISPGLRMVQQLFKVALGLDGFKENLEANLAAYKTLITTASMLRPLDLSISIFRDFPSFSCSKYSSSSRGFSDKMHYKRQYEQLVRYFVDYGFPQPQQGRDVGHITNWLFLTGDCNTREYILEKVDLHIGENFGRVLYFLLCLANRLQDGTALVAYHDQHVQLVNWFGPRFGYRVLYPRNDLNSPQPPMPPKMRTIFDTWVVIMPSQTLLQRRRIAAAAVGPDGASISTENTDYFQGPAAAAQPAPDATLRGSGNMNSQMSPQPWEAPTPPGYGLESPNDPILQHMAAQQRHSSFTQSAPSVHGNSPSLADSEARHRHVSGIDTAIPQPGYSSSPIAVSPPDGKMPARSGSQLQRKAVGSASLRQQSIRSVAELATTKSPRVELSGMDLYGPDMVEAVDTNPAAAEAPSAPSPTNREPGNATPPSRHTSVSSLKPSPATGTDSATPATKQLTMPARAPSTSSLQQSVSAVAEGSNPSLQQPSIPTTDISQSPVPSAASSVPAPAPARKSFRRAAPPPPKVTRAVALYDFTPEEDDGEELAFKAGDFLEIVGKTKELEEGGWCQARHKGELKMQLAPLSYLQELPDQPAPPVSRFSRAAPPPPTAQATDAAPLDRGMGSAGAAQHPHHSSHIPTPGGHGLAHGLEQPHGHGAAGQSIYTAYNPSHGHPAAYGQPSHLPRPGAHGLSHALAGAAEQLLEHQMHGHGGHGHGHGGHGGHGHGGKPHKPGHAAPKIELHLGGPQIGGPQLGSPLQGGTRNLSFFNENDDQAIVTGTSNLNLGGGGGGGGGVGGGDYVFVDNSGGGGYSQTAAPTYMDPNVGGGFVDPNTGYWDSTANSGGAGVGGEVYTETDVYETTVTNPDGSTYVDTQVETETAYVDGQGDVTYVEESYDTGFLEEDGLGFEE